MTTLLLRLEGPMQSWGTQSRFRERDTGLEPSKSGVIGLICAALGRRRDEPVDDLAALRMGVRVDKPGVLAVDYHTAGGNRPQVKNDRIVGRIKSASLSSRYYLADASFLVGLEAPDEGIELLRAINAALKAPRWQPCLGRKAFPPSRPVALPGETGIVLAPLREALKAQPEPIRRSGSQRYRFVIEDREGREVRTDVPLSFADRRFSGRTVSTTWEGVTV